MNTYELTCMRGCEDRTTVPGGESVRAYRDHFVSKLINLTSVDINGDCLRILSHFLTQTHVRMIILYHTFVVMISQKTSRYSPES